MSLLLHSYQYNNKPWIDSCADLLLTPWRIVLKGKNVEFVQLVSKDIVNEEPKKRSALIDFIQGRDPFQHGIQNEKYEKRSSDAWHWWIVLLTAAALLVVITHTLALKLLCCVTLLGVALKVMTFVVYARFRNIHCQPAKIINVEERDIKDVVIITNNPGMIKHRIQSRYPNGVKIYVLGYHPIQSEMDQLPSDADIFIVRELMGDAGEFFDGDGKFNQIVADLSSQKSEKNIIRCGVWLHMPLTSRPKEPPYSMEALQRKCCKDFNPHEMEQIIV